MQHRPKRSLGQNFLRDQTVIRRIVSALDLVATDQVIEIGPGEGALTDQLVNVAECVTVIEFDRDLAPALRTRFASSGRLTVIEADALEVDLSALAVPGAKLVANLPYNISTPILQRLIAQRDSFSRLVLMFQREVVERIAARPGGKERGFLSVLTENAFEVEYLFDVPPQAFYPVPKVWSAVVRLTPKPVRTDEARLRELVSVAFAQKRKTLANNLSRTLPNVQHKLAGLGLDAKVRAEQLTLGQWIELLEVID